MSHAAIRICPPPYRFGLDYPDIFPIFVSNPFYKSDKRKLPARHLHTAAGEAAFSSFRQKSIEDDALALSSLNI